MLGLWGRPCSVSVSVFAVPGVLLVRQLTMLARPCCAGVSCRLASLKVTIWFSFSPHPLCPPQDKVQQLEAELASTKEALATAQQEREAALAAESAAMERQEAAAAAQEEAEARCLAHAEERERAEQEAAKARVDAQRCVVWGPGSGPAVSALSLAWVVWSHEVGHHAAAALGMPFRCCLTCAADSMRTRCIPFPPHSKMDGANRKFAELEKRETALCEREAAAEQAAAAAKERAAELEEREAAAGVREASATGALAAPGLLGRVSGSAL